jgi:hypothetical protein
MKKYRTRGIFPIVDERFLKLFCEPMNEFFKEKDKNENDKQELQERRGSRSGNRKISTSEKDF